MSRLATLSHDVDGAFQTNDNSITVTYNPASQIVRREATNSLYAWTGHGSGSTGYAADGLNRLTSQTTGSSTLNFSHDTRGNRLNDESRSYAYDSENKGRGEVTAPWHYDPLGRLSGVSTSVGAPPALAYENYVDRLVAERVPGNATVSRRHVFGPGVDEPLVWYEGTDRRFLQADERGSIVAVSDGTGALRNVNRYDEYGRTETTSATYMGRFGYTGQRYFSGFGLYHYKNRMYDPQAGRFMQPDPIGYGSGMNLYGYVGGDPANFTDPLGLCGVGEVPVARYRTSRPEGDVVALYRFVCMRLPNEDNGVGGPFQDPNGTESDPAEEGETIIITAKRRLVPPLFLQCRGPARVLKGNMALVGKTGAFGPDMPVRVGSAAMGCPDFTSQIRSFP